MDFSNATIHFVGIGGIGVSALARYAKFFGATVSGSDASASTLTQELANEGITVHIGENATNVPPNITLLVYSEAVITKPDLPAEVQVRANAEIAEALARNVSIMSYPQALAEVFNAKYGVAVAGSHGKSTTASMLGTILQRDPVNASVLVGTKVSSFQFGNVHPGSWEAFVIEACEYKRAFLQYRPKGLIITNIDHDHHDYYKTEEDYVHAFQELVNQTQDFVIIGKDDKHASTLDFGKKIVVRATKEEFSFFNPFTQENEVGIFPKMALQVPGEHLAFDGCLAFAAAYMYGLFATQGNPNKAGLSYAHIGAYLQAYTGAWRRSEIVRNTESGNILMSDYGHHPTEIAPTLAAIKDKYPAKTLVVVFQPHQYARTRSLLYDFGPALQKADILVVPNIYFSRDSHADVEALPPEKFVDILKKDIANTIYGNGIENTTEWLKTYDAEHPNSSILLLLGAGNVDDIREYIH